QIFGLVVGHANVAQQIGARLGCECLAILRGGAEEVTVRGERLRLGGSTVRATAICVGLRARGEHDQGSEETHAAIVPSLHRRPRPSDTRLVMPSGAIVTVSLAGVLASACVQVPPFQPPDAGDGGTELQMVAVMEDHAT